MICLEVGIVKMNGIKGFIKNGQVCSDVVTMKIIKKTHSSYIGCSVCERWLTLSNFVEDVPKITGYDEEKFLNGELELDKDKKKDKNKNYVMNYCTWLPIPENHSLANKGKELSNETKQKNE